MSFIDSIILQMKQHIIRYQNSQEYFLFKPLSTENF